MKKLLIALLAIGLSAPAFAADQNAINTKKADVQQKFQTKIDKENRTYDEKVSDAKSKYANDPNKLNDELNKLQVDHNKKLEKLNNEETIKLQKLDDELKNP